VPANYVIGSHLEKFIKTLIESLRYASASEVVRDALRLLEEQVRLQGLRVEEIRADIAASRGDARPAIPAEQILSRLEARYLEQTKSHGED
jgi:antitoxin ParD1/3/4